MNEKESTDFDIFAKKFGERLQQLREEKDLTQEFMAGGDEPIEYKYYQRIEYGQVNVTLKTILKLSRKLGVEPKNLLDFER